MQGRRLPDNTPTGDMKPGDYTKNTEYHPAMASKPFWTVCDPNGICCLIGRTNHTVAEHEDGTITAYPSILSPSGGFHGYLERGVWREC